MKSRVKTGLLLCSIIAATTLALLPVEQTIAVETVVVQGGELVQSRLLTGVVQQEHRQYVISPKSGIIRKVHAQPGQQVNAGDILVQMDTTFEEQSLAKIYGGMYEKYQAAQQIDSEALPLFMQTESDMLQNISGLLADVEASSIRAVTEGTVDSWYVQEGDYIAEGALLGIVRGDGMEIQATVYASNAAQGMIAQDANNTDHVFFLEHISASAQNTGMQILAFDIPDGLLDAYHPGDYVDLELLTDSQTADALIPLSAIDQDGNVWYVEEGRVYQKKLDEEARCSRRYMGASDWWLEKAVVIDPDGLELVDGRQVRVKP